MKSSKLSLNKQTVFKFQSKNSKGHNRSCPTVTTSMLTVLKINIDECMMYCCGIVEDEPLAERMLRRYLKRFPFIEIAWECSYAEEAIDLIEKKNVDLLILDLQNVPILPDSAFFSLIAHQKCIIVTSVYPIQMLGISLNTIAFLDKPFTIESFTNAIEKFVAIVDD